MKFIRSKVKLATVLILASSICFFSMASLFSLVQAAPWINYTGEVTLEFEKFVLDSWVVKNSDTDYEMWYTHNKSDMDIDAMMDSLASIISKDIITNMVNLDFDELLNNISNIDTTNLWDFLYSFRTVIGYATSADGKVWTVVNDEVLAGDTNELENIGTPCVIKNSANDYEMWFTHSVTDLTQLELENILTGLGGDTMARKTAILAFLNEKSNAIGYTTSTNGINWDTPDYTEGILTGNGSGIYDRVVSPCVIKNDINDYEMWFTYNQISLSDTELDTILGEIAIDAFTDDDLWALLDDIQGTIGYAASTNGVDWGTPDYSTFSLGTGLWNSVATPSVVKNSDTDYEMWYTNLTTDLDLTGFQNLISEIQALETAGHISDLLDSYTPGDLTAFLEDLVTFLGDPDPDSGPPIPGDIDPIKTILANTSTQIGYGTSDDGLTWVEQNSADLTGSSGPWGGITNPCVVYEDGMYEMWYTKGLEYLSAQDLLSFIDGSDLPIGYATFFKEDIELFWQPPDPTPDDENGWNFIGLPLNPMPSDTAEVLSDIIANVQTVWSYDAATGTWDYYTTIVGPPQGGLLQMGIGIGYWIELTAPATLTISGGEPDYPYNIDLELGWNLISIPKTPNPSAIEEVLSDIIANVQTVWSYDAATGTWDYYTTIVGPPQGDLTDMIEGKAYWIEMTAADTLTIN